MGLYTTTTTTTTAATSDLDNTAGVGMSLAIDDSYVFPLCICKVSDVFSIRYKSHVDKTN